MSPSKESGELNWRLIIRSLSSLFPVGVVSGLGLLLHLAVSLLVPSQVHRAEKMPLFWPVLENLAVRVREYDC
jgi:hypothetical protein